MEYKSDKRIILTLDAGGTNFDFSAVRGGEIISKALLPAAANSLEEILKTIIMGFEDVKSQAGDVPAAISFCFPGPADFEKGVIGDLENLPLFRGGVPLKAMLEEHFAVPVYINNDGDLFTYGEAIAGLLPDINTSLEASGIGRKYRNLLGVTFGTGFGGGMVYNSNQLYIGDNSAGFEINRMRNKLYPKTSAEDSVTIRAIRRVFAREAGISIDKAPDPKNIFKIGMGKAEGNKSAALTAFAELAEVAGGALADAVTLTDSLIVIGGGLAGAWPLFMPRLVEEMNASFNELSGDKLDRLEISAFNLEDKRGFSDFMQDSTKKIPVPFSDKVVDYDPIKRIGVGISRLGTSEAVAIGAYSYALNELSQM